VTGTTSHLSQIVAVVVPAGPGMRHEHMSAWSPAEDRVILRMFQTEGRKWGRIAQALPGRSSASVRNRFLRIEKGQSLRDQGLSKNRCAACGQHKLGHICQIKLSVASSLPYIMSPNSPLSPPTPPVHNGLPSVLAVPLHESEAALGLPQVYISSSGFRPQGFDAMRGAIRVQPVQHMPLPSHDHQEWSPAGAPSSRNAAPWPHFAPLPALIRPWLPASSAQPTAPGPRSQAASVQTSTTSIRPGLQPSALPTSDPSQGVPGPSWNNLRADTALIFAEDSGQPGASQSVTGPPPLLPRCSMDGYKMQHQLCRQSVDPTDNMLEADSVRWGDELDIDLLDKAS